MEEKLQPELSVARFILRQAFMFPHDLDILWVIAKVELMPVAVFSNTSTNSKC